MATDAFRRHTRASVDAAVHRVFVSVRHHRKHRAFLWRLLRVVQARSDLMSNPPGGSGEVAQVQVLRNLLPFEPLLVREPEDWPGATGHPLRVVDSLARHLFGRYPTPRFLASVWFGRATADRVARRSWFIAHAQGESLRRLALPIELTRRMRHLFLRMPDHVTFDHALRRAEVLGLGGTPELADAVLSTRLADDFTHPERWRAALAWLVRCGAAVELAQLRPMFDYLRAHLHAIELRGRTFASVMRLVADWHGALGKLRTPLFGWPRSRWHEAMFPIDATPDEPRRGAWCIVELLDSHALVREGRAMRHCVASYAHACASRHASIWSLRHRWDEEAVGRSVLTIEVRRSSGTIVQLRGKANTRARGAPLELVRRWAAREGLRFHGTLLAGDGVAVRPAA